MAFISRVFLKGLFTLLPITITLTLLIWIATKAEDVFGEPFRRLLPQGIYIPGVGVVVAIVMIFCVGLLVNNYLTNRFFEWLERQVEKTPVIRSIYSPLKDVTQLFSRSGTNTSQRVVMVQAGDVELLGLVTRERFLDLPPGTIPEDSVAVFIPFSYGVGGFTTIVPRSKVRETMLSAEKAMQLAITGWIKT